MKQQQLSLQFLRRNSTLQYDWGSTDEQSFVARLSNQQYSKYAELWMGVHQKGPSMIDQSKTLKQFLKQNKQPELQFLFKVLSIEKCLSIQLHPNKKQAEKLHKQFPTVYVDPNDKPQMTYTISDEFQVLLGFISNEEYDQLTNIEPFKSLSLKLQNNQVKALQMLEKIVKLSQNQQKQNIISLIKNINKYEKQRSNLLNRLNSQFPEDVGLLVSCLLQYKKLPKYSYFGIEAGVPHAYIKGQCFQIMKNSDNVLRLGLTPKVKDIPNLLSILKQNNGNQIYHNELKKVQQDSFQIIQWNQFIISRIFNQKSVEKQIKLDFQTIGICLSGQFLLEQKSIQINKLIIKVASTDVFYLKKGNYKFSGKGQIVFGSKVCGKE